MSHNSFRTGYSAAISMAKQQAARDRLKWQRKQPQPQYPTGVKSSKDKPMLEEDAPPAELSSDNDALLTPRQQKSKKGT